MNRLVPILTLIAALVALAPPSAVAAGPDGSGSESTPSPIRLTLAQAIERGLEHNLRSRLAAAAVDAATGARDIARSGLLPRLGVGVTEAREKLNLQAYGLPVAPGESPIVGPFDVFDARIYLTQALIDPEAIARARAGKAGLDAAQASGSDSREGVVAACTALYLDAVAAQARVAAASAQLETAKALDGRARARHDAGTAPGIDMLRAQVELASQQERFIVARNEQAKALLALARATGLPLDRPLELVDPLPDLTRAPLPDLAPTIAAALAHRADVRAARAALEQAKAELLAARASALPSLGLTADYGKIGPTADTALETFSIAAGLRVPLFTGGAIGGRKVIARAQAAARQATLDDLSVRAEEEVRAARLDLAAAREREDVTRSAVGLAEAQLRQARDRFEAGVVSNLEVVQAQQAVADAHDRDIAARLDTSLATLALGRAMGLDENALAALVTGGTPQ